MGKKTNILLLSLIFLAASFATAQEYSIDISGLGQEEYNIGEEMIFKIILLEDKIQANKEVTYKITDTLGKKEITGTTTSNQETSIKIENDFTGGIWTITANYSDTQVKRTFLVGENSKVEFLIEGDELIIRNIGNVRYTKTIQIKIGNEINTYAQNIKAGEEKILKLVSKDGEYDIEVTDGKTTIKKEHMQLFGTGNVVGAIDKNLIGYTGFAGADDLTSSEDKEISLSKLPLSLMFVGLIGILAALTFVERKIRTKKNK
jgi:hypothetical protein